METKSTKSPKQCVCVCGEELEIKVKTEMTEDDIKQFELMWEEKWNPELATNTRF